MAKKKNKINKNIMPKEDNTEITYNNERSDNKDTDTIIDIADQSIENENVPLEDTLDVKSDIEESHSSEEKADIEEATASDEKVHVEEDTESEEKADIDVEAIKKKKQKKLIFRGLRILFTIGFFVFAALFINEVMIQPYKLKKSIEKAKDLYHYQASMPNMNSDNLLEDDEPDEDQSSEIVSDPTDNVTPTPTPDPNRDDMGRLRKFTNLLEANEDVKGWIRLDNINGENDTKIDYVVVQSATSDPEYYLERDWLTHDYLKAGSIFLDSSSSVEKSSKNLIIHGHNMTSSDDMFHYLLEYNNLDFLKEHPVISFDTIYEEALWKVFSIYITPGNNVRDDFFPYVKSNFASDRAFMEYIYQIRVRSLFIMDDIDINEDDQILTLSTCSYELKNYRTIIVARKVRDGEDPKVNTDNFEKKDEKEVLYAPSFYWRYGGKAPKIPTFDAALEDGLIPWYNPMGR